MVVEKSWFDPLYYFFFFFENPNIDIVPTHAQNGFSVGEKERKKKIAIII